MTGITAGGGFRAHGESAVNQRGLAFPGKGVMCLFLSRIEPWELCLLAASFPEFLPYELNVTYSPTCMFIVCSAL